MTIEAPRHPTVEEFRAKLKARDAFLRKARRTPWLFHGIDLRRELHRYARILGIRSPKLVIRWGKGAMRSTGGPRVTLSLWPDRPIADTLEALLHEVVHCSLWRVTRDHHGDRFRRRLLVSAREAWGIELTDALRAAEETRRAKVAATVLHVKCEAYFLDDIITADLETKIALGPVWPESSNHTPKPEPVIDLAQRRAVMIEQRAEHARRMLTKNEAKQKRAAKLVSKWRRTVRYYERAAAKKATP